ncbi:MAG: hypothetical protein RMK29_09560 [Myxococcales bacterium]|nr:hypothetical protein [Myxococcota bacterium]MDW8281947.1 hypothetical protein [Myxococcales bacterium]
MTQDEQFAESLHLAHQLLLEAQDASDLAEANALCNRALGLRPRDADAWLLKAQVLLRLEDGPAALAASEMALGLRPRSPEGNALRAAALSQMERFPEALRAVHRAFRMCEQQGGHPALHEQLFYEKAAILDGLDRTEEALETFEEGLARFPDSELLKAGIAPLLRQMRRRGWRVLDGGLARSGTPRRQ